MRIRKSMEEELVVSGERDEWLEKCENSLNNQGFKKVEANNSLYQVKGNYKILSGAKYL